MSGLDLREFTSAGEQWRDSRDIKTDNRYLIIEIIPNQLKIYGK